MTLATKHIIILIVAFVPAVVWLYLFLRQHHENKWLVLFTFIGGMIAAKLILVYQGYWGDAVNIVYAKVELIDFRSNIQEMIANTTLALFVIFLGVGVMEEFVKFWIMRFIDHNHFKSIDDVIELAIISALGFAFFENVLYFINQWENVSATGFFAFALFRVTIVTMVHVLCSGVLGYYYGMAFFASPMLKIQKMKHKKHPILSWLKKVFRMKQAHVYHDELIMIGLFTSMVLHAIYDFVLSINIRVAGIPLYIPVMLLYFFGGYWFLMALLHKKDLDLKIGMVGTSVMPKEDFAKLLEEIEVIKERMQGEIEEPVEEFTKEEIYED